MRVATDLVKPASVIASHANEVGPKQLLVRMRAAAIPWFVTELIPHFERGALRPQIDRLMDLTDLPAEKARMEAGAHVGKIVLRVPRSD